MALGRGIGLERDLHIPFSADFSYVIRGTQHDVAIQATCSRLDGVKDEIMKLVGQAINVISVAEEMAFPEAESPLIARELNRLSIDDGQRC